MLEKWDNFFMLAGTAGATLIGLLFVVVTLGTSLSTARAVQGIRAFLTPTLAHFGGVVFVAMIVLAPSPSKWPPAGLVGFCGTMGVAYQIKAFQTKRKLDFVSLHWLDWIPHMGVPVLGNAVLVAGAVGMIIGNSYALYEVAGGCLLLLIVGIYGAWDLTLWLVKTRTTP